MSETKTNDVVVALILDAEHRLLLSWNAKWGSFSFPMTKRREGDGESETPEHAAARAGAEALGVPVEVGMHWASVPEDGVSGRNLTTKRYGYEVFRVEAHRRFARAVQVTGPHLWLTIGEVLSGEYGPISPTCVDLCRKLVEARRLPGRSQHTSVVVVSREESEGRRYLLRWDDSWGFSLPATGREASADAAEAAKKVAMRELGLIPGEEIITSRAAVETYLTHGTSKCGDVPTFYLHALFQGEIQGEARPKSTRPLAWASLDEIRRGKLDSRTIGTVEGPARSGEVSWTVIEILKVLESSR